MASRRRWWRQTPPPPPGTEPGHQGVPVTSPHQEQQERVGVQGARHQVAHGGRVLAGIGPVRARAPRLHLARHRQQVDPGGGQVVGHNGEQVGGIHHQAGVNCAGDLEDPPWLRLVGIAELDPQSEARRAFCSTRAFRRNARPWSGIGALSPHWSQVRHSRTLKAPCSPPCSPSVRGTERLSLGAGQPGTVAGLDEQERIAMVGYGIAGRCWERTQRCAPRTRLRSCVIGEHVS